MQVSPAQPLNQGSQASILSPQMPILLAQIALSRVEDLVSSERPRMRGITQVVPGVAQLVICCVNLRLRARPPSA